MTQQTPEQPTPTAPAAPAAPPPAATPETGKQPPWGDKPENFDADKAWELIQNLRNEKSTPDPQLRSELDSLKQAQAKRDAALAAALGNGPEEISDADKLAKQVSDLQEQFAATRLEATRLTVAQNNGIPPEFQGWLTATDPEALDVQAKALVPMVQATLAQRGQAPLAPGIPATPAFVPNPGQGQVGTPSPEAATEAEYAAYASRFNKNRQQ